MKRVNFKNILLTSLVILVSGCVGDNNNKNSFSSSLNSSSNMSTSPTSVFKSTSSTSSSSNDTSNVNSSSIEKVKEFKTTNYTNPLYNSEEIADPACIYCEEDNYYYMVSTGGKIMRSRDMVNWQKRTNAFPSTPAWGTNGAGLWAPDIQYIKGQYVLYYSLSVWNDPNPGIGVAVAKHPKGPWIDQGKLFTSQEIGVNNSIDPMAYVDHDGRVYLVWGSMRGNYIVELEEDGLSLKGGVEEANKNKIRVAGLDTSIQWEVETYEGAYIIYENGYYYLFLSMGTCCEGLNSSYKVVVGRSRSVTGPYLDHNLKDMKNKSAGKVVLDRGDYFVGSGHNCLIKDQNGDYYTYYHTYSQDKTDYRVLAMDAIHFDEDGWPYVENYKASKGEQNGPTTYDIITA